MHKRLVECIQWLTTFNKLEEHSSQFQPGSMALGIFNALAHRANQLGDDKVGLGRWCWARLRGKENITI